MEVLKRCSTGSQVLRVGSKELSERCIEWFVRGDSSGMNPVSTCNQQMQQLMQSSRMGFNNDNTDRDRGNTLQFQMQDEAKVYHVNLISGQILDADRLKNVQCSDLEMGSLQGRRTRPFIDAWSKEGLSDDISNKGSITSLTLSMSGMDEDNENHHPEVSIGMLDSERSSGDEVLRSQWLNPVSWMSGGPLGEALCLGNATNLPSPQGYSNSTATSSCSFNSCENGSHGLDFIG